MKHACRKGLAAAVLGLVLVTAFGAAGSFSLFTAQAQTTNTIALGSLSLSLSESGWAGPAQLRPGTQVAKDPTLTVGAGSADCYVFATVDMLEPQLFETAGVTLQYRDSRGEWHDGIAPEWELLESQTLPGGGVRSVYAYHEIVAHTLTQQNALPLPLFGRISVPTHAAGTDCSAAAANSITVKGWAIQASGFANRQAAWAALLEKTT